MKGTSNHGRQAAACLICVFLLFGVFFSTPVNAAENLDAKIFVSYDFQEDFDMIFNCKIYTSGDFTNIRLSVTFDGKTEVINEPEFCDPATGFYRFVFRGVSAAEMTSIAKATLIANIGNTEYRSDVKQACIKDYAMALINYYDDTYNSDDNAKKLCTAYVDMLNYGAAAQKYFGKNTSNLANKDLTSAQQKMASSLPTSASSCYNKKDLSNATAEIQKIALSFENPVDLVVYSSFSSAPGSGVSAQISYTDSSNSTKTIKVPSSAFEYQQNDNLYRVEFKDIPLDSLTTPLTVVFKNNTKDISATITYSCESYAKSILGGSYDANVKDLVKKMLVYGDSAKAYAATLPTGCVTYRQFGAMGIYDASKTDNFEDYYPLIMTHDYANANNLPVEADKGAHYFAKYMNPRSYKGALIKTDTDWGKAKFTIDDKTIGNDSISKSLRIVQFPNGVITEGHCFLFSVEPSQPYQYKWTISGTNVFLGLDANISSVMPEYPGKDNVAAKTLINRSFPKDTELFEGDFKEKALYCIATSSKLRWARNDKGKESGIDQEEVIVINDTIEKNGKKYGVVDSATKPQWDWSDIWRVLKYPIDEETLHVKGGTFTTIVNTDHNDAYIHRGISIVRSNVLMEEVKHYLIGEEDQFPSDYNPSVNKWARYGRPYQGFFRLDHCAYVTLKNCLFSDHLRVDYYGTTKTTTAPYDYYAEFAACITIDGCTCAPITINHPKIKYSDSTGYMDELRWGTTGSNFCKDIRVINYSALSRIDAHKGTRGLTVKDSTMGYLGIVAVGFGEMNIENVTSYSENFISLRHDFGSAWFGDINITNCTWNLQDKNYSKGLIKVLYDCSDEFLYDPITINGETYYSSLPKNIHINGLTVDVSNMNDSEAGTFYSRGFNVFDQVMLHTGTVNESFIYTATRPQLSVWRAWMADKDYRENAFNIWGHPYMFPLKTTDDIYVDRLYIKCKTSMAGNEISGIFARNPNHININDAYFFTKSKDYTTMHLGENLKPGEKNINYIYTN